MKNKGSILLRLDRMETLLNNHLEHHQEAFNRITKVYIPILLAAFAAYIKYH